MNKKRVVLFLVFIALVVAGGFAIKLWKNVQDAMVERKQQEAPVAKGVLGKMSPEKEEEAPDEDITSEWVRNENFEYFRPVAEDEEREKLSEEERSKRESQKKSAFAMPKLVHDFQSKQESRPEFSGYEFPKVFAPFGTMIPCTLVTTVESNNQETPVVALVTRDVYQNGKLVVEAGTYVNYLGSAARVRDRVYLSGTWVLVWENGKEYRLRGVALDREKNPDGSGYAITDGSAGLRGYKRKTDEYAELKIMLAAALSGFSEGNQDRRTTSSGDIITEGSLENGAKEGVSQLMERYIEIIEDQMEAEWYYVRVPAGKEFYLYAIQTVEPTLRSYGGLAQDGKPASSYQLAQAKYQRILEQYESRGRNKIRQSQEHQPSDDPLARRQKRMEEIRAMLKQKNNPAP